ncbi:hypothetical protein GCM10009827_116490 [Dactylosporangium maewongense]|uniref:CHASE domain-containing protein n=1 Tax=Dactylosporangium maewongense TaxID=634393 RepID=A0ABN2DGB9_9ACTN
MELDREVVPPRRGFVGALLVVATLLAGLALSTGATYVVRRGESRYAGQVMDRYTEEIRLTVADRVALYSEALTDLAWAVGAWPDLTRADFNHMTSGFNAIRFPGASGVAFVVPAGNAELGGTQTQWRDRGEPDLHLTPGGTSSSHAFVIFEEAFDNGPDMSGVDVSADPAVAAALDAARQNGVLMFSPVCEVPRDADIAPEHRQHSVLLGAPVYASQDSSSRRRSSKAGSP